MVRRRRNGSFRHLISTALTVLALLAGNHASSACSLPPESERTPEKRFADSTSVVLARVTEARLLDYIASDYPERMIVTAKYDAQEVFKGKAHRSGTATTITLFMCGAGFPAVPGNTYLLYLDSKETNRPDEPGLARQTANSLGMIDSLNSTKDPDATLLAKLRALAGRK